jgi:hypothetical protein
MAQPSQFELSTQAYDTVTLRMPLNGDFIDQQFYVAPYPVEVVAIYEVHGAAGTNGSAVTAQVERLQGTEAPGGNGDALLGTAFDLKATANTVQTGTLVTTSVVQLAAGNRLGVDITGTTTTCADGLITILLKRI